MFCSFFLSFFSTSIQYLNVEFIKISLIYDLNVDQRDSKTLISLTYPLVGFFSVNLEWVMLSKMLTPPNSVSRLGITFIWFTEFFMMIISMWRYALHRLLAKTDIKWYIATAKY